MNRDISSPVLAKPTSIRYGVLGFACALSMITYLDRVCIGMASEPLRIELGLGSVADMKWAFTAFSLAYAIFEVPTGWLGDVFGRSSRR
jgi:MFS family permease